MKKMIIDKLEELKINFRIVEHGPVFTVAESKMVMPEKFPVKNLLLKEEKGDRLIFVIMNGDKRLDTKQIATFLGCKKLQFAKPEILKQTLGVEPGSASLFSLLQGGAKDVEVVVDEELLSQPELGFHPNINTETIIISGGSVKLLLSYLNNKISYLKIL